MTQEYASKQPHGFKNHIEKVAIVGVRHLVNEDHIYHRHLSNYYQAGGQIGKFITEHLLKNGKHQLTAITREGSSSVIPDGLTVKHVDYNSHESLVTALKGQDCLIITLSVFAPEDQHAKLVKAAADAGVPWIVPNE